MNLYIPKSGGKAGTGKNRTSNVQVRDGDILVKQFRFKVADFDGRDRATAKAQAFIKQLRRANEPDKPV